MDNDSESIHRTPQNTKNELDLEKQETSHSLTGRNKVGLFAHPLSHVQTSPAEIVDFDGPDDPYRPLNWPFWKKVWTTLIYGFITMGSTWASSVYAPAIPLITSEFGVSQEVGILGISFLLMGFGLGPMVFGPLSEVYGRKPAVLIPYFFAACFSFGTATAKDMQTVLLMRFFAGLFGSAPVTNTGGVLSDIWSPQQRGTAFVGYASAVIGGPTLGPIVGGAIVQSYLGWRWTEYLTGIMMSFFLLVGVLVLDETYAPALLVSKARRLRHETGNWALHARHEEWDVSIKDLAIKFGARPFQLLMTPIAFCIALYASFCYAILYTCLSAIPIAFGENRGWGTVTQELPFLALLGGVGLGGGINIMNNKYYIRSFEANDNKAVPEARLPPMMIGSVFFTAGLFIFGWTSDPSITPVAPILGAVCMGFGFFTIFQAALNYLVDSFETCAASAVAANTFLRSVLAAAFPLFTTPMFHNLGIPWASSLLGFIAIGLLPIPYIFYIYGPALRKRGKYTAALT